ncbi:hypothetical protein BJX70DRAFT_309516 [Aspergillus crustosus]
MRVSKTKSMKQSRDLVLEPTRVGVPRLDPYQRLLARFYESLFLLKSLGQTRGGYTAEPASLDDNQTRRRRFLQNLSYICDFKKGGRACTAIAVEDRPDCNRFWVASNMDVHKIVSFVEEILGSLRGAEPSPGHDQSPADSVLIQRCATFAVERIEDEGKCLRRYATKCISKLAEQDLEAAQELLKWLKQAISHRNNVLLCTFAYNHRHSGHTYELAAQALRDKRSLGPTMRASPFDLVRHYLGRLAQHIRAPKSLVEDSYHLEYLIQSRTVCAVSAGPAVPCPMRDLHTNLSGILNRMFKSDDEERAMVEEGLLYINKTNSIFHDFVSEYDDRARQVHAEIQILEHFHQKKLSFVDGDRYIACSKPACLCCELYFKYHPAHMVVPSSHQKVWTAWSPPFLPAFVKGDSATQVQKRILSSISQDLRVQIIQQVLQRSRPSRWHPDSRTGITDICPELDFDSLEEQDNSSIKVDSSGAEDDGEHENPVDLEDGGVCMNIQSNESI